MTTAQYTLDEALMGFALGMLIVNFIHSYFPGVATWILWVSPLILIVMAMTIRRFESFRT